MRNLVYTSTGKTRKIFTAKSYNDVKFFGEWIVMQKLLTSGVLRRGLVEAWMKIGRSHAPVRTTLVGSPPATRQ